MNPLRQVSDKIVPLSALKRICATWAEAKLSVVFTNGVYDIVHRGHITLLAEAAAFGDKLILGINSDSSVRTLGKGPGRPINKQEDRAFVMAAMNMVDLVVIFDEQTPYELIRILQPDVLVKGGDYSPDQLNSLAKDYIVGSDLQRAAGRKTVVIPIVDGYSTTALVNKLAHGQD